MSFKLSAERDWWDIYDYPSSLMDQFFGTELVERDLLPPAGVVGYLVTPRTRECVESSGKSEVRNDDKKFQIFLDVSQFKPEELEVKVVNHFVVIHAKQEEKDEKGFIFREFTRRYVLPRNCDADELTSELGPDGTLKVKAPKKAMPEKTEGKQIPITKVKEAVEKEE